MPSPLVELAQMALGSGVLTGALAYAVRTVPTSLAAAKKLREEAALAEVERKRLEAEAQKVEAEAKAARDRSWEENTGRIYKDQRTDIESARAAAQDCEERVDKLAAECAKRAAECAERDAKNQAAIAAVNARLEAQQNEVANTRAALKLYQAAVEKLDAHVRRR